MAKKPTQQPKAETEPAEPRRELTGIYLPWAGKDSVSVATVYIGLAEDGRMINFQIHAAPGQETQAAYASTILALRSAALANEIPEHAKK